jgi:hypothetical protein
VLDAGVVERAMNGFDEPTPRRHRLLGLEPHAAGRRRTSTIAAWATKALFVLT